MTLLVGVRSDRERSAPESPYIYNHQMKRAIGIRRGVQAMTTPAPGEPLISFKDVRVSFDEGEILRGISFEVWHGETKVLLGVSGSGKTVIMKVAAGLLRADGGEIRMMGRNVRGMSERELLDFRRNVGFVFQEGALFDSMTVAENVAFRLREEKAADETIESRVRQALRFVELENAIDKYPAELSGGMRRRVSIARALVDNPPVVFYDSPTAGLDPVTSQTIITLIMRGRDLQGVTSLLATHRVQDAFGLANFRFDKPSGRVVPTGRNGVRSEAPPTNVLVLRHGEIYFEGAAEGLLQSSDEYLKRFLASAE
jgi:phospholipid/cholesterol/gamma-HCH transport system ATP-binding protein